MKHDLVLHKSFSRDLKVNPWVRPSDWLTLPTVNVGDNKIVALFAVFDRMAPVVEFCKISGSYTVDWGDGTEAENFSSGAIAGHTYDYSALPIGSLCSRGYKQVIVTITPQPGQQLTSVDMTQSTSSTGARNLLDVEMAGENISVLSMGSSSSSFYSALLERFCFIGPNVITSLASAFRNLKSLAFIPPMYTSACTDFSNMFYRCYSLSFVPLLDTSKGTTFNTMFSECYSLQYVPDLDLSEALTLTSMFRSCRNLVSAPFLTVTKATAFDSMFYACENLISVPLFFTGEGTNFTNMFYSCTALYSIPLFNTAKGLLFDGMFYGCACLSHVPGLNLSLGVSFSSFLSSSVKLSKFSGVGIKENISLGMLSRLSTTALVEIFNNLASGVSGKTITISGTVGSSYLTLEERAIATDKGWTITG